MSLKLSFGREKSVFGGAVLTNGDSRARLKIARKSRMLSEKDTVPATMKWPQPWPGPMQRLLCLSIFLLMGSLASAAAASLQVAPVSLEFPPGAKASQLTLQNLGDTPIDAQIRVFRWSQKDGEEQLTSSTDLVASPPAASLAPGQNYIVRLVRASGKPVEGEESFRLLIDELPQTSDDSRSQVNFIVRYSIPIFFAQTNASPQLAWSAASVKDQLRITVRNDGTRHVRISGLKVEDSSGHSVSYGQGLVGYVLAHSTMHRTVPAKDMTPGSTVRISAQGDNGQLGATAVLESAGE
jgi:fimbrial chaperone protein